MRVEPEYYREQAKRSRNLARRTKDPDIRDHLMDVAKQYDKLANGFQELLQPLQLVAALPERHSQFVVHALQLENAFLVRFEGTATPLGWVKNS